MKKVLGATLLVAPFVGMFVATGLTGEWLGALAAWGVAIVLAGVMILGISLLVPIDDE